MNRKWLPWAGSMALVLALVVTLLMTASAGAVPKKDVADQIFHNGKILTVDENFSIAQAIAITGERIVAVGTNGEILRLKGPNTVVTNLHGKTVIPGLIDNHQHFTRAIMTWRWEVRFDAVDTRARAVELIEEKVASSEPLDWVLNIGGWSPSQFTDSQEPFTQEELDILAPDNPVYIASGWGGGFCNTLALKTIGWRDPETRPPLGWIPVEMGEIGVPATVRANLPRYVGDTWKAEWLPPIMEDYNRSGLTTVWSSNGGSADHWLRQNYQQWLYENVVENGGWTNLRVIHDDMSAIQFTIKGWAGLRDPTDLHFDPEVVFQDWPEEWTTPGGTGDYFRVQGNQEAIYGPVYRWPPPDDPLYDAKMIEFRTLLDALVARGGQVNEHTMGPPKFGYMLDFFEDMVQTGTDMTDLRWSFHHCDNMVREEMERAKELDMFLSIHPAHSTKGPRRPGWPVPQDRFKFRTAQELGIRWGLGSDSGIVAPNNPFFILSFVVTGKDIPGNQMQPNETVSREDALTAYTRSNAWRLFMEEDLGSIESGKYADIVVLDRDYLTCPEDEIRDIESILTIVGGRVGYIASEYWSAED